MDENKEKCLCEQSALANIYTRMMKDSIDAIVGLHETIQDIEIKYERAFYTIWSLGLILMLTLDKFFGWEVSYWTCLNKIFLLWVGMMGASLYSQYRRKIKKSKESK